MKFQKTTKLTARELEILNLLSQEFSTKEIAQNLNLSCSTIESHRRNLLIKMQVRNVAGLIRRSFEVGILSVGKNIHTIGSNNFQQASTRTSGMTVNF